jgi:hypothetical protein
MYMLKAIYNFLGNVGRVRAASYLERRGNHEGAKRLMMEDFKGWI